VGEEHGSISQWLDRLKTGDAAALEPLWERYFHRLVDLARARLGNVTRGSADEEDVALDAMDSLCRGVARGRFPRLDDRDDLWRVLACITARKAFDLREREGRVKRGGDAARASSDGVELDDLLSQEPTPEVAALLGDESRRLLESLKDDALRVVARLKLEGWTNEEIATRLQCASRTVERKLHLIRTLWIEAA
jgi:DNA-directed RNA polymerase specialized sigma24 family protein